MKTSPLSKTSSARKVSVGRVASSCSLCGEFHGWDDDNLFARYSAQVGASRIMAKAREFVVIPSLGPLVDGHLLLCTRRHWLSLGDALAHGTGVMEMTGAIEAVKRWLQKVTGNEVVIFEHGAVEGGGPSGACTEHAHLHLMPVPRGRSEIIQVKGGEWQEIAGIEDLTRWVEAGRSYLYYRDPVGKEWARGAWPTMPRQYLRTQLALAWGLPERCDWRADLGLESIAAALERARRVPLII